MAASHDYAASVHRRFLTVMLYVTCALSLLSLKEREASAQTISSPNDLLTTYDLTGDNAISRPELYFGRAANALLPTESILSGSHDELFSISDINCDGLLDVEEIRVIPGLFAELARAGSIERLLREERIPAFRLLDGDGDGLLSSAEWLVTEHAGDQDQAYQFLLCDFDGDGHLSFRESVATSRFGQGLHEPDVPDPIVEEMERVRSRICTSLSAGECDTKGWSFSDVLKISRRELPYLKDVSGWDLNGDQTVTRNEIRYGLELAFGIRSSNGMLLRRPNGQVFNLRTCRYFDLDQDGQLAREEFTRKYWFKGRAEQMFEKVDLNGDDTLSPSEWSLCYLNDLFWIDTLADFKRFDTSRDARISPEELSAGARSFENNIAEYIFPGFDLDGDNSLTFLEFRSSPLNCPILDWNRLRWDTDEDASLTIEEFQTEAMPEARAIATLFYSRLDQNHDDRLTLNEIEFNLSWSKLLPELAFTSLDVNRDDNLSLEEVLTRISSTSGSEDKNTLSKKLASLENAFSMADTDGDALVSRSECLHPEARLVAAIGGRRAVAQLRRAAPLAVTALPGTAMPDPAVPGTWPWRLIGLAGFNVLALVGVAWLVIRNTFKTRH